MMRSPRFFWQGRSLVTTVFISVVSSAVLHHDVLARAGDVSMGIAAFAVGSILLLPFESLSDG